MPIPDQSLINKSRAHDLMDRYGIDAVIAATPENVAYTSNYDPWLTWVYRGTTTKKGRYEAYTVLPEEEATPPALLTQRLPQNLSQSPSWIEGVYTWGSVSLSPDQELDPEVEKAPEVQRLRKYIEEANWSDSAPDALVTAVKDRGLEEGVIALDMEGITPRTLEHLESECPDATILDGGEFFRLVRAVKSPAEIDRLRTSAEINERALNAVLDAIEEGVTEKELAKLHRTTVTELGAVPDFFNLYAGKRCGVFWEPSDRPIQNGDLVWMDGGCIYERYHSDTGTCAVVGEEPTDEIEQWYEIAEAGLEAALDAVAAGVKCSEVSTAMHEAIREAGSHEEFGFGHAIGIEPRDTPTIQPPYSDYDDPILDGSTDIALEENMVINLEVPYRKWNMGAVQIEYSVIVTSDGYEKLTDQKRKLHVV